MLIKSFLLSASITALGLAGAASADGNSLLIEQVTNSGASVVGNYARGDQDGQNNRTEIQQSNNFNFAVGDQAGNQNRTLINQFGARNTASARIENGSRNGVDINQAGNRNYANLADFQNGSNSNSIAINQSSSGNFASISTLAVGVSGSVLSFSQSGGNGNVVGGGDGGTIGVGNSGDMISYDGLDTNNSDFDALSNGSSNPSNAGVTGAGHYVATDQIGARNVIALSVSGSGNTIQGGGNDLTPAVNNQGMTAGSASGTGAYLQDGSLNQAMMIQQGNKNTITGSQIGNQNSAAFRQVGSNNTATSIQQ